MATFNLANQIFIVNPAANVDSTYGPYNNLAEANAAIVSGLRVIGRTVGIITAGAVVEYWWESGITDSDLVVKSAGGTWGSITGTLSAQTDLQTALDGKVDENVAITGATKTKITYDAKGLVTAGADLAATDLPSGIDATKIADGSVTNAEFQYLNGVSSAIQTQLDGKEATITAGLTTQYFRGDKTFQTLNKISVGLGNVENTSDANKPISTATQSALDGKVDENASITGDTKTKITYDSKGLVISGADLAASDIPSGIDAAKIGAGSVDNTEFSYLNGVTSSIQNQLNGNVFSSDFTIALAGGKTFGKFVNGSVVPATGKTAREVILLAAQEALTPTVSLTSPTTIQFNQTSISNVLNFSYTINSLGATVASVSLEWRRNNTGSWTVLTTNTALTTFTHTDSNTNFNTQPFNYRYTVTDTSGGSLTVTRDIIPAAYLSPTITKSVGATTRYLGDIASTISGNVTRRSALVDILSYSIEVSVNGGAYTEIHTASMAAAGAAYSFAHNNVALVNSTSLAYRAKVVDAFTTTTSSVVTISFVYHNALGFNSAETITLAQLEAFGNISLTNSKARTFTGVTASATNYTYYVYAASAGDLSNVILDGTTPILGAFTKLTDLTGTNLNGADVTYRVYRSNAKGAFTNNSIQFS